MKLNSVTALCSQGLIFFYLDGGIYWGGILILATSVFVSQHVMTNQFLCFVNLFYI